MHETVSSVYRDCHTLWSTLMVKSFSRRQADRPFCTKGMFTPEPNSCIRALTENGVPTTLDPENGNPPRSVSRNPYRPQAFKTSPKPTATHCALNDWTRVPSQLPGWMLVSQQRSGMGNPQKRTQPHATFMQITADGRVPPGCRKARHISGLALPTGLLLITVYSACRGLPALESSRYGVV